MKYVPPGVRDQADVDERRHEARRVGGDPDVARARDREPGPAAGPLTAAITGFSSARIASTFGW